MRRNIGTLHNCEPAATKDEIRAAALQYSRKVSGSNKPSRTNPEAFRRAVDELDFVAGLNAELAGRVDRVRRDIKKLNLVVKELFERVGFDQDADGVCVLPVGPIRRPRQ